MQSSVLNLCRPQACDFSRVIPEIDIWRAATLMLKRYGDKALEESRTRIEQWPTTAITTAPTPGAGSYAPGLCAGLQPVFRLVRSARLGRCGNPTA